MFNGWILRIIHEELVKKVRRWCSNPSDIMDTKEHSAGKISIMKIPHTRSPQTQYMCLHVPVYLFEDTYFRTDAYSESYGNNDVL